MVEHISQSAVERVVGKVRLHTVAVELVHTLLVEVVVQFVNVGSWSPAGLCPLDMADVAASIIGVALLLAVGI